MLAARHIVTYSGWPGRPLVLRTARRNCWCWAGAFGTGAVRCVRAEADPHGRAETSGNPVGFWAGDRRRVTGGRRRRRERPVGRVAVMCRLRDRASWWMAVELRQDRQEFE